MQQMMKFMFLFIVIYKINIEILQQLELIRITTFYGLVHVRTAETLLYKNVQE